MRTDIFPLNYFKSITTPTNIFKGRKQLNWFQIVIIFLFLNGLMMIPLSINLAKMDSYPVQETFPNAFELVDESVVTALQEVEFSQGAMIANQQFYFERENGVVGGNVSNAEERSALQKENALLFLENELVIKEGDNPVTRVMYTEDFSMDGVTSVEGLQTKISEQWFIQNKSFIVGSLLMSVFILLLVSIVFICLGAAVFVYLTKKGQLSSIKTYKESVNLIVNTIGLSTVIALIIGFIQFDIIVMIMTQTLGFVIMLLIVFAKTRFHDSEDIVEETNEYK
ncbi:component of transporter [Ornithinibacillus contaminans]|uniref:component of transporter n=1 Tax=Ornithinibacillus contaminans TaxID=694055 RepID=UPI00064D8E98|nr:component of transporter [Ornithinibacillus contaminans]